MLDSGMTPKEVVEFHLDTQQLLGKSYFYTNQFQNQQGVEAHRKKTGAELVEQLTQYVSTGSELVLVSGAGTGATFTGTSQALREAGFLVNTVLVEPEGCNMRTGVFSEHRLEGISVGVVAPFLDWSLVHRTQTVRFHEVLAAQRLFYLQTGLFVGNSSAANIAAARSIRAARLFINTPIVTIAYDSGLWYGDFMVEDFSFGSS